MKKPSLAEILFILCILLAPFLYTAYIYPQLPATIPTHFNIHGQPDKFSEKNDIWLITGIMGGTSLFTYLLISFITAIDPKKTAAQSPALVKKIAFTVVIFLSCISIGIVRSTVAQKFEAGKLILPLTGLFFAVMGNYMHSIKPNYFIGFRTPWTLENEDNWRKTHQLVAKLWVPGGILITLATLLAPLEAGIICMLVILIPMVVIPAIFSYRYFKKHRI